MNSSKLQNYKEVDLSDKVATWEKWWQGDLGRPLFYGAAVSPDDKAPSTGAFIPILEKSYSEKEVVNYFEQALESQRFFGDGFPLLFANFGPGVLSAFVGGEGDSSDDTVWFEGGKFANLPLNEFEIKFDPNSLWCQKLSNYYRIFAERFGKNVQIGMTDLGGVFDILSALRSPENLLMDLYDEPDTIKRLLVEENIAWQQAFLHLEKQFQANAIGTSCWANLLAAKRMYILQSDFTYMISPDMFEEFALPELNRQSEFLDYAFFHMDGPGELPHFEHILKIKNLRGVQWIPGAGQAEQCGWQEIMERIDECNLKLQLIGSIDSIRKVLKMLKHPENAQATIYCKQGEEESALNLIAEYN